ncbi:MAG: metallophosphoesterase family protein [Sphaerochaetaceae bacterium]
MRVLVCADIHMGRRPELAESGHAVWDAIIQKALALNVDVVALVGDVVEQERAWLSVYGPLLDGLTRLKEAGIAVIGVGGNHDWSVFPRLAAESDAIKILGLNGTWEAYDVQGVRFIGWSFPSRYVKTSPFATFKETLSDTPHLTLGLLHADFGQSFSAYAPIDEALLQKTGVPLWMLGHIHKAGRVGATIPAYYCGSPYALDAKETGVHGVYLLESENAHAWKEPVFIPLCPYRYERYTIDVTNLQDVESIRTAVTKAARAFADSLDFSGTLALTPVFTGSLRPSLDLLQVFSTDSATREVLFQDGEGREVLLLNRQEDATELEVDLVQLAKGSGPEALLARMLTDKEALQQMGKQYQNLDEESYNISGFKLLQKEPINQKEAITRARYSAMQLLKAMIAQRRDDA